MNKRTLKRQMQAAQGLPLRVGPAKGSTGENKGPARTPSLQETRANVRRAIKLGLLKIEGPAK